MGRDLDIQSALRKQYTMVDLFIHPCAIVGINSILQKNSELTDGAADDIGDAVSGLVWFKD
jgi:hypothetical protein